MCILCVECSRHDWYSGHVTKQDQRLYVKIETLCGPLFWTSTCGKCCPIHPYSPDMSPCNYDLFMKLKEPFRDRHFPTLNDLNLAITWRIRELNSNGLLDGVKKLSNGWKCVIEAKGTTLNDVMWKLTWMNKFDWFLAVCALLLKWTSYYIILDGCLKTFHTLLLPQ